MVQNQTLYGSKNPNPILICPYMPYMVQNQALYGSNPKINQQSQNQAASFLNQHL